MATHKYASIKKLLPVRIQERAIAVPSTQELSALKRSGGFPMMGRQTPLPAAIVILRGGVWQRKTSADGRADGKKRNRVGKRNPANESRAAENLLAAIALQDAQSDQAQRN
jgi:hypothetical protein